MPANEELPIRKLHRLSSAAYATTEYEYYFTICARHQGEPFTNATLAQTVIDSLLWTRNKYKWLLYCYCLMPDHLHFVTRLTTEEVKMINTGARGYQAEGVLDHLARFKSFTTSQYWKLGFKGPLWQKNSFDRVLDIERPFIEIVQYTLENPQRKELVQNWEDWPYAKIVDPWWS